jgi:hypothetical protein
VGVVEQKPNKLASGLGWHRNIICSVRPAVVVGGEYAANCRRAPLPEPDVAEYGRSSAHLPPASFFDDYSTYERDEKCTQNFGRKT